jgi:hypothetical protein
MQLNRHINIGTALSLSDGASGGTLVLDAGNAPYKNIGQSQNPVLTAMIFIEGAPTGTNPTVQFFLQVSADGVNFISVANTPVINSTGLFRLVTPPNILEPFVQMIAVIGGTSTPTFPDVDIDLFMTSPDS